MAYKETENRPRKKSELGMLYVPFLYHYQKEISVFLFPFQVNVSKQP